VTRLCKCLHCRINTGRSRKSDGESILIANRRNIEREAVNIEREYMMGQAVEELKKMCQDDIANRLKALQNEIFQEEKEEEEEKSRLQNSKKKDKFDMKCKLCGQFAVSSTGIRCYREKHYAVVDTEFYQKITCKIGPKHPSPPYDDITFTHDIFGKESNCEHNWGVLGNLQNTKCAFLQSKSFVIKDKVYKKWKSVPYHIDPMNETVDLKALPSYNDASNANTD